ncbi:diguanylate cyclase domain-containing protein [Pararhodospirillum oryzae]|uniref:Diguanylate cyclase n=1 Tax=Pararhodospirillum oryzae TaxID=478448 RepID=A0A512H8D0_9PROT|nr:diguanylate cyclase [Pararhodospirillum oryzae]GEO81706.1 diguanylate cyclase [Pararhodospirillum oryzae]
MTGQVFVAVALLLTLLGTGVAAALWRVRDRLRLLETVLEHTSEGVMEIDRFGRVVWAGRRAATMLGYPDGIRPGTLARVLFGGTVSAALAQGSTLSVRGTAHRPDGGWFPALMICATPLATNRLWLLRDLSAEQELARLRTAEERASTSQRFAGIGIWDLTLGSNHLFWSDEMFALLGVEPGAFPPRRDHLVSLIDPEDTPQVEESLALCLEGARPHDEDFRVTWPDGSTHWLRETANLLRDESGRPLRMVGVVRDITAEKEAEHRALRMALHDPLTGLPNRAAFDAKLDEVMTRAREDRRQVALAFIDLDRFKPINDKFGHGVGDQVLTCISHRLSEVIRPDDMVARVGGDEFVAVLGGCENETQAQAIAGRLLEAIRAPIPIDDTIHKVSASIGVSLYPRLASSREALIHTADLAMYAAKRTGSLRVRVFTPDLAEGDESVPIPRASS